jgi:hypothetical protein
MRLAAVVMGRCVCLYVFQAEADIRRRLMYIHVVRLTGPAAFLLAGGMNDPGLALGTSLERRCGIVAY